MYRKCLLTLFLCVTSLYRSTVSINAQESRPDIEALRRAAANTLSEEISERPRDAAFTSGALGLQKLNPEISVTGDILWSYGNAETRGCGHTHTHANEDDTHLHEHDDHAHEHHHEEEAGDYKSDFMVRGLGLHLEAYLDPFTRFKAAFSLSEDDVHLGEAYMTRFGIVPHVSLTLGKFRQQFGVVNRWHKHGLDQVDFPLALRQVFGPGGLNQTGGSIEWSMPGVFGLSHELTVQITDGENDRVFGENSDNEPSTLAHYKIYRDLSDSTYAELGLTGLHGRNNEWQVLDGTENRNLASTVAGIDITVLWEPTDKMRYRNATWRSEAYFLDKNILPADGSGEDAINAWGGYSYLESKASRTLILGVRGDYFVPDVKDYAEYTSDTGTAVSLSPLAVTEDDSYRWQVGPYITWHQSPFVHFRAEYNHQDGDGTGPEEKVLWLQCIFAAGPHKHERY